jgi:hypothetical protein
MNKSIRFTTIMLMWAILLAACAPGQIVEPQASAPTSRPPATTAISATKILSTAITTATADIDATTLVPTTLVPTTVVATATPFPTETSTTEASAKEIVEDDVAPVITFARSGGFAGIEEEWQIYGDGRIVNERGQTWQTEDQEVTQLLEDIGATSFLQLEGSYMPKNSCCDRFTYVLTVIIEGETQQVTTIDAAPNTPDAFWETQKLIQDFIEVNTI